MKKSKSIKEITEILEETWVDEYIDVRVWKEDPEDEDSYWNESYTIPGKSSIYTGRGGFIIFRDLMLQHGGLLYKIKLNHKEITLEKLYDVLNYSKKERKHGKQKQR